ncbi:hypothetical protein ACWD4G_28320 [Streptomyces sp. NPDC002643]
MPTGADFEIETVAIGRYENFGVLEDIDKTVAETVRLLGELGGAPSARPGPAVSMTFSEVRRRLDAWAAPAPPRNSVLLWTGHGGAAEDDAWLAYADTTALEESGLGVPQMAGRLRAEWKNIRAADSGAWTMLVVEACGAATFARRLNSVLTGTTDFPERLLLVGVGGDGSAGYLGTFNKVLRDTIRSFEPNDEKIELHELARRLYERLKRHEGWVDLLEPLGATPLRRVHRTIQNVTVSVDDYQRLRRFLETLDPDERRHFVTKAQGTDQGADTGELAWFFVGRGTERRRLVAWLHQREPGLHVVTGPPGTGKSALLGNLAVHARREMLDALVNAGELASPAPEDLPPPDVFDAVVHLAGLTVHDLVTRLSLAAELPAPPAGEPGQAVDRLRDGLRRRPGMFTVLCDALDEAEEPGELATLVLRRLAELPTCRIIVGTRPHGPGGEDLIGRLTRARGIAPLVLDRTPDAQAEYVERRLTAARATGLPHLTDAVLGNVVGRAGRLSPSFLSARIVVAEIIARPELLLPEHEAELDRLLGQHHETTFAAMAHRLGHTSDTALPLLHALALARGRGLPRSGGVWATAAAALADGRPITEEDIDDILERAAPYILFDAEDGQTVYRLSHYAFQEHFLGRGEEPTERAEGAVPAELAVTRGLLTLARDLPVAQLNPYLSRHLVDHVAAANAWRDLADEAALLDRLDPETIASRAQWAALGKADLPPEIAGVLGAWRELTRLRPADRALVRVLAGARATGTTVPWPSRGGGPWRLAWTALRRARLTATLGKDVVALGPVRLPEHGTVLAALDKGRALRFWDLTRGEPVADPLVLPFDRGAKLFVVPLPDGRPVLVVLGEDDQQYLHLHDLRTWQPVPHTPCPSGRVMTRLPDGRTTLACAMPLGTVCLFDPESGAKMGEPFVDHTVRTGLLAAVALDDGADVLLLRNGRGQILFWPVGQDSSPILRHRGAELGRTSVFTLDDGRRMDVRLHDGRMDLSTHTEDDTSDRWESVFLAGDKDGIRLYPGPGGTTRAVVRTDSHTYRTLDIDTGELGPPLRPQERNHDEVLIDWPPALDSPVAVSVRSEGRRHTLEYWDMAAEAPRDTLPTVHDGGEDQVLWPPGRKPMTANRHYMHGVRVWDMETGESHQVDGGGFTSVTAMAPVRLSDGGPALATATNSRIRLWDASAGRRVTGPERGMRLPARRHIRSIAQLPQPDGRLVIVTRSGPEREDTEDGEPALVELWIPATGRRIGDPIPVQAASWLRFTVLESGDGDRRPLFFVLHEESPPRLRDLSTGAPLPVKIPGRVWDCRFAVLNLTRGPALLIGHSATVSTYDLDTGETLDTLPLGLPVQDLAVVGSRLLVATRNGILALDRTDHHASATTPRTAPAPPEGTKVKAAVPAGVQVATGCLAFLAYWVAFFWVLVLLDGLDPEPVTAARITGDRPLCAADSQCVAGDGSTTFPYALDDRPTHTRYRVPSGGDFSATLVLTGPTTTCPASTAAEYVVETAGVSRTGTLRLGESKRLTLPVGGADQVRLTFTPLTAAPGCRPVLEVRDPATD